MEMELPKPQTVDDPSGAAPGRSDELQAAVMELIESTKALNEAVAAMAPAIALLAEIETKEH